jgi:hypothetical protein
MNVKVGTAAFIVIVLLVLALIAAVPLITIWSFNTLFGLAIGYNLGTWFAMFWLHAALSGAVSAAIRKNDD